MKKQFLLSFIFLACIVGLNGQITVNSSDFVGGEDTSLVSIVTDFQNIDFSTTGANSNWDFTTVLIDTQRIDSFYNVGSSGFVYQLVFDNFLNPDYAASYYKKESATFLPNNLPLSITDPITFYKLSSDKFERVGYGATVSGTPLPIPADTIDMIYSLPMTFQDNWISNSFLYIDLNPIFAAEFKRHQTRASEVDGYGTITTPYGTFDAIRVKSTLTYIDSINIDIFSTGGVWTPLPTDANVEYTWWAKNEKIPVFSIVTTVNLQGETVSSVEFKDDPINYASILNADQTHISVYPNPSNGFINIESNNQTLSFQCYSIGGQLVHSDYINTKSYQLNTENWESGIYFLHINQDNKTSIHKIIIE